MEAYGRAFELDPSDNECRDRATVLKHCLASGAVVPPAGMHMIDSDLRNADYTPQEFSKHGLIRVPGLRLDDSRIDGEEDGIYELAETSKDSEDSNGK